MSMYDNLKQKTFDANQQLPKRGIVIYTFGNVSIVDRQKNVFCIKPSGVPYEEMKPEDMVVLDMNNNVIEGDLNPSSDTNSHWVLYKAFPEIGSIVHTHSTYAVAWAQTGQSIPILGTTHADHLAAPIPCTPEMPDSMIQGDYEEETGKLIVETVKKLNQVDLSMILVSGHGPFTWGKNAEKAVYNAVILETIAKMAYITLQIKGDSGPLKKSLIKKHFERKHGDNAYYGQK